MCDGTSTGSPVLSDGHAAYTSGLSENGGGTSSFYSNDKLGNLWTVDGAGKNQLTYEDFSGFGGVIAGSTGGRPFGFSGGNGCQTDTDINFVLMGHRYYDPRVGRFISQDPAKAGGNWYAYAGNNPVNKTDPTGLTPSVTIEGSSLMGSPGYSGVADGAGYAQNFASEENFRDDYNQQIASAPHNTLAEWDWSEAPGAVGDAVHIINNLLPDGPIKTGSDQLAGALATYALSQWALGTMNTGTALLGQGWNIFTSMQFSGQLIPIGAGVMGDGLGALAFGATAYGVSAIGAAYVGYQIGTGIANYQWSPGYTTTDYLSNKFNGLGSWLNQNTSFGH